MDAGRTLGKIPCQPYSLAWKRHTWSQIWAHKQERFPMNDASTPSCKTLNKRPQKCISCLDRKLGKELFLMLLTNMDCSYLDFMVCLRTHSNNNFNKNMFTYVICKIQCCAEKQNLLCRHKKQQEVLTIISTFLGLHGFLISRCPHAQPLFTYAVQWCGLQVHLAVWKGLGGHGHAVQEAGEHRVASRRFLNRGFNSGVVA